MALHWIITAIGIDAKTEEDAFTKLDRILEAEVSGDFTSYVLRAKEDDRFTTLREFNAHMYQQNKGEQDE